MLIRLCIKNCMWSKALCSTIIINDKWFLSSLSCSIILSCSLLHHPFQIFINKFVMLASQSTSCEKENESVCKCLRMCLSKQKEGVNIWKRVCLLIRQFLSWLCYNTKLKTRHISSWMLTSYPCLAAYRCPNYHKTSLKTTWVTFIGIDYIQIELFKCDTTPVEIDVLCCKQSDALISIQNTPHTQILGKSPTLNYI